MDGGGYGAPPPAQDGGEVLLRLLHNPPASKPSTSPLQDQSFQEDPAIIRAVGPEIHTIPLPQTGFTPTGRSSLPHRAWNHGSSSSNSPFVHKSPNSNPNLNSDGSVRHIRSGQSSVQGSINLGPKGPSHRDDEQTLVFGSFTDGKIDRRRQNSSFLRGNDHGSFTATVNQRKQGFNGSERAVVRPSGGSSSNPRIVGNDWRRNPVQKMDLYASDRSSNHRREYSGQENRVGYAVSAHLVENPTDRSSDHQMEYCGVLEGGVEYAVSAHLVENPTDRSSNHQREYGRVEDRVEYPVSAPLVENPTDRSINHGTEYSGVEDRVEYAVSAWLVENPTESAKNGRLDDGLSDQFGKVLDLDDESEDKAEKKKHHRDRDYRSDNRGKWIMNQRIRYTKSLIRCRRDINRLNAPFIEIYESLIPAEEEKAKQLQLLGSLKKLVVTEWPNAELHLYGSCANSFGFPKSDIDVCLVIDLENKDKTEAVLKLAEILESGNLQDVQAFTRARVPIVKLKDPVTCISCDICVNNALAVVNTKLLRDYVQIDARLRQLAFIVKHWAKSRQVNETYRGTLSSYAYVLMCIHFLQQRNPPILPCLQGMEGTYSTTVENVECTYFDRVDRLQNFGSGNRETIAQLVWAFFRYWAYCHDYAMDVISVRTGTTLSKQDKDWTRRVGNDRHLICIEDPFEVSHDLGRVVDRFSVRVLREEFERAAWIMQHDPNPCSSLFEPYVPI